MAKIIYKCLDCRRTYDTEESSAWKRDMISHGICDRCNDKRERAEEKKEKKKGWW